MFNFFLFPRVFFLLFFHPRAKIRRLVDIYSFLGLFNIHKRRRFDWECFKILNPEKSLLGWDHQEDPFKLTKVVDKEGVVSYYARGSTDDKGPVLGWLNAIEAYQELGMALPVNIKVCAVFIRAYEIYFRRRNFAHDVRHRFDVVTKLLTTSKQRQKDVSCVIASCIFRPCFFFYIFVNFLLKFSFFSFV